MINLKMQQNPDTTILALFTTSTNHIYFRKACGCFGTFGELIGFSGILIRTRDCKIYTTMNLIHKFRLHNVQM